MIRNIVLDMGNVILRFDTDVFMDRVGLTDPADREWMDREVFRSLEWAKTDRGSLTPEEAAEIMKRRVPERLRPFVCDPKPSAAGRRHHRLACDVK